MSRDLLRVRQRPSPTGLESSVLRRVRAKVINAGPPPVGLSEQEALTDFLRCQDLYALRPQRLADYDPPQHQKYKGRVVFRR